MKNFLLITIITSSFLGCEPSKFDPIDEGTTDEGSTEGTIEDGTTKGTADKGTTDEGTTDEGTTDEGSTEGATDTGTTDEATTGTTDEATTDEATNGTTDEGATGTTDEGATDEATVDGGGSAGEPTFTNDAQAILQEHCSSCHTSGSSGGHSIGSKFADAAKSASHPSCTGMTIAECAIVRIEDGGMPPGNPNSVSDEDLKILKDWVAAGAPE